MGDLDGQAVSQAVWGMAVLGGSAYFLEEMEALCELLPSAHFTKLSQVCGRRAWRECIDG
jgi:hypothetical protein